MQLDATPPIDPGIERVLTDVLGEMLAGDGRPAYDGAWRRAALREGVEREDGPGEPVAYAFSPRSTRGATRA